MITGSAEGSPVVGMAEMSRQARHDRTGMSHPELVEGSLTWIVREIPRLRSAPLGMACSEAWLSIYRIRHLCKIERSPA